MLAIAASLIICPMLDHANVSHLSWRISVSTGRIGIAVLLACLLLGDLARGQEVVGVVTRIQREASVTSGDTTRSLSSSERLSLNDVVRTSQGSRLEIEFLDETRLTLGENAELTLDRYVFNPAAGVGAISVSVTGAFRFLSGQLSKLASSDASVRTRIATIGVRGTEFWGGPIDDQALGVFLIQGAVSVRNAAGAQLLTASGQGTNLQTAGAAPGPITFWPPDKVARAVATVAFQ